MEEEFETKLASTKGTTEREQSKHHTKILTHQTQTSIKETFTDQIKTLMTRDNKIYT